MLTNLNDLAQYKTGGVPSDYPIDKVLRLYSPYDQVHEAFKALIGSASKSLFISMYGEDDPELTALIVQKAQDAGIFVQVNLDKTQAAGSAEVPLVKQLEGCPMTRVAVGSSASGLINHLKMAVVDGLYVLSGSTNWSKGGEGLGDGKHGQNNECSIHMDRVLAEEATMVLNKEHLVMLAQMGAAAPVAS